MQFDIRSFLESGRKPFEAHFEADFSKADFGGYSVNNPAVCDFTATLTEDGAALLLCVRAHIDAECARCLEPLTRDYDFTREYFVRDRDWLWQQNSCLLPSRRFPEPPVRLRRHTEFFHRHFENFPNLHLLNLLSS